MIRPPGWDGVAFSEAADGDVRGDHRARDRLTSELEIPRQWAAARQVHGADVIRVSGPGDAGEADALWSTKRRLPMVIFTADCFGVVLAAPGAVGVAHAGWRGTRSRVVARLREEMAGGGHDTDRAAVGPGIGPCCFEVGPEVAEDFPGRVGETTWGTPSVDLPGAIVDQLSGLEVWSSDACTRHDAGWFSHRADGTTQRLATIGWVP